MRPGSKLVLSHKGQAFELAFKHRQLDSGPEIYRACNPLQQTISRLYRHAGIGGTQWQALTCSQGSGRN